MMGILIAIHIIACIGLIFFILIQSGRGGGLIESFSSAESIFGTKTNTLLTKFTTGLAITFFITCLSLAFLSVQQNKSIVEREVKKQPQAVTTGKEETTETAGVVEEATEEAKEVTEKLPEAAGEAVDKDTQVQTETTSQTQENNAASEEAAAIQ